MSIFWGLSNIFTQNIYNKFSSGVHLFPLQFYLPSELEYESDSTFSHFHVCLYVLNVSILLTTMIYFHIPSNILSFMEVFSIVSFCYKFSFNTLKYYILLVHVIPPEGYL